MADETNDQNLPEQRALEPSDEVRSTDEQNAEEPLETAVAAGDMDVPAEELEQAPSPSVSDVEQQVLELKREKDELYDRLLRKQADFENYRKRSERDKREFQHYAVSELVFDLLVILDNFERALSHSEEQTGTEYRKGVELIYRQLKDVLLKKGLRTVQAVGQTFDPNFHEAISREERNDLPENTVLEEMQKGYLFRDKLLRPAMVKVSYRTQQAGTGNDNIEEEDSINVE